MAWKRLFTPPKWDFGGHSVIEGVHRSRFNDTCRWTLGNTKSQCFSMGEEAPKNCPLPWVNPDPHLIHGYLGPLHPTRQTPSRPNQPSLHGSCSIIPILYYGTALSPPQNCPFPWGDPDPHLIHGDCGPPHPTCQTASRSVQPFCHNSSAWPTDGHRTDRQTMNIASNRSRIPTFGWQPGPKNLGFGFWFGYHNKTICITLKICYALVLL